MTLNPECKGTHSTFIIANTVLYVITMRLCIKDYEAQYVDGA